MGTIRNYKIDNRTVIYLKTDLYAKIKQNGHFSELKIC
jgi:hypothetical protein